MSASEEVQDLDQNVSDHEERPGEDRDDGEWLRDDNDEKAAEEGGMLGRRSEMLVPETLVEEIMEEMVTEEELPGLARASGGHGSRGRVATVAHQSVHSVAGRGGPSGGRGTRTGAWPTRARHHSPDTACPGGQAGRRGDAGPHTG